jgi:uroporphyrinogen-III decarboxylase
MQHKAGADIIMLFDTWGGLLGENQFKKFSLLYMNKIVKTIHNQYPDLPIILFTKGGEVGFLKLLKQGVTLLDWTGMLTYPVLLKKLVNFVVCKEILTRQFCLVVKIILKRKQNR